MKHRQEFKDNNTVSTKSEGKFGKVKTDIGWKEKGEAWELKEDEEYRNYGRKEVEEIYKNTQ